MSELSYHGARGPEVLSEVEPVPRQPQLLAGGHAGGRRTHGRGAGHGGGQPPPGPQGRHGRRQHLLQADTSNNHQQQIRYHNLAFLGLTKYTATFHILSSRGQLCTAAVSQCYLRHHHSTAQHYDLLTALLSSFSLGAVVSKCRL